MTSRPAIPPAGCPFADAEPPVCKPALPRWLAKTFAGLALPTLLWAVWVSGQLWTIRSCVDRLPEDRQRVTVIADRVQTNRDSLSRLDAVAAALAERLARLEDAP